MYDYTQKTIKIKPDKAKLNRELYLVSPTIAQLNLVLFYLHTKDSVIEKIWNLPTGTLKRVRYSGRPIPAKYWHLFYHILSLRNEYLLPPKPYVKKPYVPRPRKVKV